MKFEFSVDRGGTFTDVFCVIYDDQGSLVGTDRLKLLSEDYHYEDPISEGIRRIISKHVSEEVPALIPCKYIQAVRIGTTIGTNALLERKGARTALVMTKGFKDLLKIGNQSRPKIFELDIKRPSGIYETVIEIDERIGVRSVHEPVAEEGAPSYTIDKSLDEAEVLEQFKKLKSDGIESVAICLLHSHEFGGHELKVGELALKAGFESIFLSHQSSPKAGYLARSSTCLLDAYLSPILRKYTRRVASKFENNAKDVPIYMMQSDGALTSMDMFTGSKSILSGPAGGVAGYAKTTPMRDSKGAIGFDMGGTSTDVSTYEGTFEMNYESEVAGVFVSIPHLDINTVAAGGGSCLYFENGLMRVGPESAGSNPGPVCYGKDGLLAVTDLNLILGRIQPEYFPKIFGKDQNEPLNYHLSKSKFEELAERIRRSDERLKDQTTEEIAFGFIQVANEVMCRPIRALTESRGKDPKNFNLGIFGGAGSQHACAVARNLGIKNVFIHKYSSILSAYGIFLADILKETSLYCNTPIQKVDQAALLAEMRTALEATKVKFLQSVPESSLYSLEDEISYVLKFSGSEGVITVNRTMDLAQTQSIDTNDLVDEFKKTHTATFGFLLEKRDIVLTNIYMKTKLRRRDVEKIQNFTGSEFTVHAEETTSTTIFFQDPETQKVLKFDTPVYQEESLPSGWKSHGPALVVIKGSSIVVEPGWECSLTPERDFELVYKGREGNQTSQTQEAVKDPVMLSIFGQRFMSIAEQMGRRLQRTSVSTNIKERLDFSCAIFGPDGSLVANAPHLPVHLGSMESTVTYQIDTLGSGLKDGDVVISNHPRAGGSHLPDITAITPCFYQGKPIFFVASRGHHSDIGGKTPGSMPAFAQNLSEEGVAFKSFKIVSAGVFQEPALEDALRHPPNGIQGSRNVEDNIADLKAQVAANQRGVELLLGLVEEYGLKVVHGFMNFIQEAAEESVRAMLVQISLKNNLPIVGTVVQQDFMDDGTKIALKLTIDRVKRTAKFDFTDSGMEVLGNFNTPPSVLRSAIIYCLRCLVKSDIPLNAGCLRPVSIEAKEGSILCPSEEAAIVGGNVTTSQRITDVILKAFKAAADSQGCMNNFTFGDETFGYYETIAGGSGAGPSWNGCDAVQCHMTNTRITDPEILESRFPVVLLQFAVRSGSGGTGATKGGNGVVREFRFKKRVTLSILSERRSFAPQGLLGGEDGAPGVNSMRYPDGRWVNLGGKCSINIEAGTVVKVSTPGGGGYGLQTDSKGASAASPAPQDSMDAFQGAGSLASFNKLQEQA